MSLNTFMQEASFALWIVVVYVTLAASCLIYLGKSSPWFVSAAATKPSSHSKLGDICVSCFNCSSPSKLTEAHAGVSYQRTRITLARYCDHKNQLRQFLRKVRKKGSRLHEPLHERAMHRLRTLTKRLLGPIQQVHLSAQRLLADRSAAPRLQP